MTREALLEPVIASIRKGTALSRRQILEHLADWDVEPIEVGGQHVGTMVAKGTEVHMALVPGWRPASSSRGWARALLRPRLERYEFLTTRVWHHRPDQKQFVQRVGFKPTWADDNVQYYLLGNLPFERKQ